MTRPYSIQIRAFPRATAPGHSTTRRLKRFIHGRADRGRLDYGGS